MGSHQPDDVPDGVLVLEVAPVTPSSSALPDDTLDLPDDVGQTTSSLSCRRRTSVYDWL